MRDTGDGAPYRARHARESRRRLRSHDVGRVHVPQRLRGVMIDLGTLGGEYSEAVAISERGQIIGYSETSDGGHAVLWDHKLTR
jgi:probable HAF family extracellular repeat protein